MNEVIQAEPAGTGDANSLIPEWKAEDFATNVPYDWLWQYKDNKFLLQQMLAKAQIQAKAVKFTGFMKMWNAYVESNSPRATIMGDYVTMFPGQPAELNCGKYICDDYGISYQSKLGDMIEVCPHPLMPLKRIADIDSGEEKLEIAYLRGKNWRTAVVSREVLATASKAVALAKIGIAINSENAKEIVKYITDIENLNFEALPFQKSTDHMGWMPDRSFAPFNDEIVYSGEGPEFERIFYSFRETGDYDIWLDTVKAVRAGKSVPARIALAASFAAPLVSVCQALPFFVHLWGTQGCGKTVGLMLAASVWGNPDIGSGYIKSFSGTKVSQELYAAFCGNVPVLLDELQVISDRRSFDDMIYMLCEGISKGRGSKYGGMQIQKRWSTCMITTGEMPIVQSNSGGGASVRTIEINYGGEPLFEDARATVAVLKENYGFAGRRFVEQLEDEKVRKALPKIQRNYYSKLSGEIQDKQVLSASILLTADKLADLLIFHDHRNLTVGDIMPYLVTQKEADVNYRCHQWLIGYIGANPRRFDPADQNNGEVWGVIEDGYAYIIKSVFERLLRNEGFSPKAFLTWGKKNDMILCDGGADGNKRLTKRKTINNIVQPCAVVRISADEDGRGGFIEVQDDDMPF